MAQLKLIRASAGSGKTFNLTRNFLEMVLNEPSANYYRHILAVTFTNKATAEMKERILKELHILATNQGSDHLDYLVEVTGKTRERIQNQSGAILNHILHGYSWFRVETIDTFFQGVIRSFVRELNIPGHYNIELDQDKVLDEAINRMLDKLDNKHKLIDWMLEFIDKRISDGKSWDIKKELQKLGKSLFKEDFIRNLPELEVVLKNEEFLNKYRDAMFKIVKSFEERLVTYANKVIEEVEKRGFEDHEFYYKGSGTLNYFRKTANKDFSLPGKYLNTLLESPEKWPSKTCCNKEELITLGINLLNPTAEKISETIEKEYKDYNSANEILRNLHILGLLTHLQRELQQLKNEKGLMLISDASPFIQKIINNNDTPFIYEKIGNRFHHLLIDEFQDTSTMQWGNFKPLVSNCLSNNHDCLLVGDVKQSIYRWRNSNWEILAHRVKEEITRNMVKDEPLTTNWRSSAKVVRFNNAFFTKSAKIFQKLVPENLKESVAVDQIYDDVEQEIPTHKDEQTGYSKFKFFEKDELKDNPEYYTEALTNDINSLLSEGYAPGDIAILVRDKKDGTKIANFLVDTNESMGFIKEVGVISNESLFLESSPVVKLLIATMKFVNNTNDKLAAANLYNTYALVFSSNTNKSYTPVPEKFNQEKLADLIPQEFIVESNSLRMHNLYSVAERVSSLLGLYEVKSETVYHHSFLDIVYSFSTSEYADLSSFLDFWEKEGSKKTISAAETSGSIRILTIHKSKGLEYPAVLIPFVDWDFKPKPNEQLWVTTDEEPYGKLPSIPINYTNKLEESVFANDYELEQYRTLIDNINLMYVAFTRAKNALIGYFKKSGKTTSTVGDITFRCLDELQQGNIFDGLHLDINENTFEYGKIPKMRKINKEDKTKMFSSEHTQTALPEVKISSQAEKFLKHIEDKEDAAIQGRIYHSIMERIKTPEDLPEAIKCIVQDGILSQNDAEEIEKILVSRFNSDLIESWFDDNKTILTETDIIGLTGQIHRPDRVIIEEDLVTVVDYKFGLPDDKDKHINQVKNYMHLIKNMGFDNVDGYIWYVLNDQIAKAI